MSTNAPIVPPHRAIDQEPGALCPEASINACAKEEPEARDAATDLAPNVARVCEAVLQPTPASRPELTVESEPSYPDGQEADRTVVRMLRLHQATDELRVASVDEPSCASDHAPLDGPTGERRGGAPLTDDPSAHDDAPFIGPMLVPDDAVPAPPTPTPERRAHRPRAWRSAHLRRGTSPTLVSDIHIWLTARRPQEPGSYPTPHPTRPR